LNNSKRGMLKGQKEPGIPVVNRQAGTGFDLDGVPISRYWEEGVRKREQKQGTMKTIVRPQKKTRISVGGKGVGGGDGGG